MSASDPIEGVAENTRQVQEACDSFLELAEQFIALARPKKTYWDHLGEDAA